MKKRFLKNFNVSSKPFISNKVKAYILTCGAILAISITFTPYALQAQMPDTLPGVQADTSYPVRPDSLTAPLRATTPATQERRQPPVVHPVPFQSAHLQVPAQQGSQYGRRMIAQLLWLWYNRPGLFNITLLPSIVIL